MKIEFARGGPTPTAKYYRNTADEAFALGPNLIKLYALKNATKDQLTFNYRLSKARCVVECAFGILAAKLLLYCFSKSYMANATKGYKSDYCMLLFT